jgi:branched-chain amino acid aminotransferase
MSGLWSAASFATTQAYRSGRWTTLEQLSWSATDVGTTHGVILVERLRTFGGRLFALEDHLQRLAEGAAFLGIDWSPTNQAIHLLCDELLERNAPTLGAVGDVGVVLLLSPGDPGIDRREGVAPTLMLHLYPLPIEQLKGWYHQGTHLHVAETRNVPAACWSPGLKTRSRLQYYLADRRLAETPARRSAIAPTSVAVLLSTRATVTETSISNLIVVDSAGKLRSPPLVDILVGVSLKTILGLAGSLGYAIEFTDLYPPDLLDAQEVLMTGSTGCVWSAVSLDGKMIGEGRPGQHCRKLQQAWEDLVSFRFTELG